MDKMVVFSLLKPGPAEPIEKWGAKSQLEHSSRIFCSKILNAICSIWEKL